MTSIYEAATFECSLDGAAFSACSAPKSYTSLSLGNHTFRVRATDVAGNIQMSPTTYAWTIVTASLILSEPQPRVKTGVTVNTDEFESISQTGDSTDEPVTNQPGESERTDDDKSADPAPANRMEADPADGPTPLDIVLTSAPYVVGGSLVIGGGILIVRRLF